MKKVLGALLAVGLAAGTASAAQIGIEWNPATIAADLDSAGTNQSVKLGVGSTATIDMVASIIAGDTLSTVSFEFSGIAGDPLSLTGATNGTPTASDFATTAGAGALGAVGVQIASASANPLANSLSGPGSFVLGNYDLSVDNDGGTSGNSALDIFIAAPQADVNNPLVTVLNMNGGSYIYGPNLAGATPGFFDYGIGSPAITNALGNQAANPLQLTTPEPSSLALLAIGGIALLRRR